MATTPMFQLPIETPQQVQKRLQQQRLQMFGSGDMVLQQQALVGNAMDALFGNKEVNRARTIQDRIMAAQKNVEPQEGDDDVTAELRRLTAMRDAVSDLDPEVTSAIHAQIMQLGQIKLERDKLRQQTSTAAAQERLAGARTAKAGIEAGVALNKDQRDEELHPVTIDATRARAQASRAAAGASRELAAQRGRELVNFMNPQTGQQLTIKAADTQLAQQLMDLGYVKSNPPSVQGSKEDVTGLKASDASKELLKFRQQATEWAKFAGGAESAIKLIDANPNAGTLPGDIATFANTAKQNFQAMLRSNGVERPDLTKEGVSIDKLVGASLPRANAQMRGMVTVMVYAQARANDPGGRLSNQEVEQQARQFGEYSPQQIRDTLVRLMGDAERNLNIAASAVNAPADDSALVTARNEFKRVRESVSPKTGDGFKDVGGGVRMRVRPKEQ